MPFRFFPIVWCSILCFIITLLLQFPNRIPGPEQFATASFRTPAQTLLSSSALMSAASTSSPVLNYLPRRRVGSSTR